MKLIEDALEVLNALNSQGRIEYSAYSELYDTIAMIETEPVRHGHWIAHDMSTKGVPTEACSVCGEWSYGRNEEYCSCCGCKMDEAVRCGDCKWFDSKQFVDGKERPVCHRYEKIVDENNFCLKGEVEDGKID